MGHINRDNGETWLDYDLIAEETLGTVSSAKRAVAFLVKSGHLIKLRGGKGKRDANTYRLGPVLAAPTSKTPTHIAMEDELDTIIPATAPDPKPTASDSAIQLAARFTELLAQPKKHSTVRRKHWPGTFDAMLADHSHADLLALLEWVFNIDKFWHPKIRAYSGDPADYFAEHLDNIITAMAHPVTQSMSRTAPRTAPKYDIDAYLNHN
jgi:hypothetical protein